ncbi:tRNA 4-thiouridine(8) synthase ThiI [Candidatus Peregrinibacteria bacterium]|nr:tRNA 4-thiouridine(8) synthase ThiI [Candidatus Peregrinibacteria bacterium]
MRRFIIVHYGEIGLKKANIEYFVEKLRKRLRVLFEKRFKRNFSIKHSLSRFLIALPGDFTYGQEEDYAKILYKVFGIKNFKFVYEGKIDIEKLSVQIWENLPAFVRDPDSKPRTFRVRVKRSMILPFKSIEAERQIGACLLRSDIGIKVKMENPEFVVDVEFFNNHGYFSFKKYDGPCGLSANSQGKLVSLISAGIDSPVASYMMMKRGARVIFVHFHGYPYTDKAESEHVRELVKMLSDYQFDTKLYLVPFGQFQKKISTNLDIPAKIRTVIYRRLMLRIAELIAKSEKARGLITGDNFGQVASQTPENIFAIHEASTIPIYQPLIGFDKEDIIGLAEKIGTFEISKLPCKDTCGMFMPEHPEIKANIYDVREYEKLLPLGEWLSDILKKSEIVNLDCN